jgi:hypothetical protein
VDCAPPTRGHGELANYFRKYIRGFAAVVTPLTKLLKGLSTHEKEGRLLLCGRLPPTEEVLKRAFVSLWIEAAFTRVQQALTSSPVLVLPDFVSSVMQRTNKT